MSISEYNDIIKWVVLRLKNRWPDRQTLDINHNVLTDMDINIYYQLYELDLKWDLFIGYSRHFNSQCVYRKSVVGWENLLKAVVMNEVYSN